MKQAIRYFSLGLLLSALLLYGYQFVNKEDATASLAEDELIQLVENEGYHVITEEEYISFSMKENLEDKQNKPNVDEDTENEDTKPKEAKESDNNKDDKDAKKVTKTSIKIKEGIYTPQLADMLIDEKIIDDRKKFLKYMDDNDYSDSIQLGTFNVSSDMSLKELAETFTTYPSS